MKIKHSIKETRQIFKKKQFEENIFYQLPMKQPLILNIDPSSGCNFKCFFCPTGNPELLKSQNIKNLILKEDLFLKFVNSIKEFDKNIRRVNLYKFGEPFLNKNLEKFVQILNETRKVDEISTTTNASLMFKDRSKKIIEAGLTHINISVEHVSNSGYKKITKVYDNYQQVKENIFNFYELKNKINPNLKMKLKIANTNLTGAEIKEFEKTFSDYCDYINVEYLHNWNDVTKQDQSFNQDFKSEFSIDGVSKNEYVKICSEPFFYMGVHADGLVSCCVPDWSQSMIIGNLQENTLKEIWNSDKLNKIRLEQIKNRKLNSICKNCSYPNQARKHQRMDQFKAEMALMYNLDSTDV